MLSKKVIAEMIWTARVKSGMTKLEMARKIGISRKEYSEYEAGTLPRIRLMEAITDILRLELPA